MLFFAFWVIFYKQKAKKTFWFCKIFLFVGKWASGICSNFLNHLFFLGAFSLTQHWCTAFFHKGFTSPCGWFWDYNGLRNSFFKESIDKKHIFFPCTNLETILLNLGYKKTKKMSVKIFIFPKSDPACSSGLLETSIRAKSIG